jgi:transposase
MGEDSAAYVAFDTAKLHHAVAVAEEGRTGEVRFIGEIESSEAATVKLVKRLSSRYRRLTFCYEAGPTGYELQRLIARLGHECVVVAPSLIPKKPGERVKTNRRDAESLARLLRAGELAAVWVPDGRHEAMRDLTRAREAAVADLVSKRQQVLSLLLRLGRGCSVLCLPRRGPQDRLHHQCHRGAQRQAQARRQGQGPLPQRRRRNQAPLSDLEPIGKRLENAPA